MPVNGKAASGHSAARLCRAAIPFAPPSSRRANSPLKNPYPRWGKRDGGTEIFFYYTPFFSICKRSGLLQQKQPLQEFHTLGQHGFVIKAELRGVELRRISHTQQEKQKNPPPSA